MIRVFYEEKIIKKQEKKKWKIFYKKMFNKL